MSLFNRRRREVPMLNTAALPDLIFTVLFFFHNRYTHEGGHIEGEIPCARRHGATKFC